MQKIPFEVAEIRVNSSSMGGFSLDIIIRDGMQLKSTFRDEKQYDAAVAAKGNITQLKTIFNTFIKEFLSNNPQYIYYYTNCELFMTSFDNLLENPEGEDLVYESFDLIRHCAVEKNIEFDGYYQERWRESADSIINFDEDYFDDPDKIELYVFLSAAVDEEIFGFLHEVYSRLFNQELSTEMVLEKIEYLTKEKGVRF